MATSPHDELDGLQGASSEPIERLLLGMQAAKIQGDHAKEERLFSELAERLGQLMWVADFFGRRRLMLEADAISGERVQFAMPGRGLFSGLLSLTRAKFMEAINDLVNRDARVAPGWKATQEVYTEGGFAAARSASEQVTASVQNTIRQALDRGTDRKLAEDRILRALRSASPQELEGTEINPAGFTRAYSDTVLRTVVSSSYARGRREQAQAPAVRRVTSGFRFTATLDPDVRANHKAADGLVAHMDDPIWADLSPPLGYSCRCSLELVPNVELKRRGLANADGTPTGVQAQRPQGAYADDGFTPGGGPLRG